MKVTAPGAPAPHSLHEVCEAARLVNCGECWALPGDEYVSTSIPVSVLVIPSTPVQPTREHLADLPGGFAEQQPHLRVDGPARELGGVPGSGPGQAGDVQGWPGEPGRRAETGSVAVQRADDPAQIADQPPGRPRAAVTGPAPR